MDRWHVKLVILVGTFVLPFFCTILPYKLSGCIARRGAQGQRILSYLMCFGGGIFFGTYLLHMGPEVHKLMTESLDKLLNPNRTEGCLAGVKPITINYPLADLFIGFGFFIVLFSEKLVLYCNKKRIDKKKACKKENGVSHRSLESKEQQTAFISVPSARSHSVHSVCAGSATHTPSDMCKECTAGLPCSGKDEDKFRLLKTDDNVVKLAASDIEDLDLAVGGCRETKACPFTGTGDCCSDPPPGPSGARPMLTQEKHIIVAMKVDAQKEEDTLSHVGGGGHHHHATRSIILILALSLHRIFEGMSIGLQHSTHNVLQLFLAVMCHETVIGFSLGLQFVKSSFPMRRLLLTSFLCSMIMPIGVAIGTAMTEVGHHSNVYVDIANGVLQAIAMGTFIYVTFFEILQEEVDPEDTSLVKILFIFAGFVMMALLDLIPEEDERLNMFPDVATVKLNISSS